MAIISTLLAEAEQKVTVYIKPDGGKILLTHISENQWDSLHEIIRNISANVAEREKCSQIYIAVVSETK